MCIVLCFSVGWIKTTQGKKEDCVLQQHAHRKENQQCKRLY